MNAWAYVRKCKRVRGSNVFLCVCVYVCVYVCVSMGNGFVNLCVCKCFNVACVSSKSGASSKSVCKCINMTYDTI